VILCLAANPSIDRLFEIDRLRPGEVHRPESFVQVAGGKGVNVARAAAALGAEVQVLAILAGHAGRWLAEELGAAGISVDAVWVEGETRSSLSVADRAGGGLTEFYERGPEVSPGAWAELAALARERSSGRDWLTVSGSLPAGASREGYRRLSAACPLALDSTEPAPADVDLIKVNAAEAARLTGADTGSADGALTAARELRRGAAAAAVTRGDEGAVLVTEDGSALTGALDASGRYPVGSGDAFLAGLVVARAAGGGWVDATKLALGAAAANAAVPGAGRFSRDDAERLAGRAVVSSI
jgi:1-phosphofructokinase family hexose kinase